MRSKPLILLAAVTGLAVVGAGVALQQRAEGPQTVEAPAELFPGLLDKVNDVQVVSVTLPEVSFTIRREGDGWVMPEKDGYPVKFETVKKTVVGMASLQPREPKTAKPANSAKFIAPAPRADRAPKGDGVARNGRA